MRTLAILALALAACGRVAFDPTRDGGSPGDGDDDGDGGPIDSVVVDTVDGPPHFGAFPGPSGGRGLVIDRATGDIIVAGWIEAPIDLGGGPLPYSGGVDMFLARYSASGEHRWSHAFGGTDEELLNALSLDAAGNIFIGGRYRASIDFGGGPMGTSGDEDAFVASFTAQGAYRWARRIGGSSVGQRDAVWTIAATPSGTLQVVGVSNGPADAGGPTFTCGGSQEMFLVELAADGSHMSSKCYGNGGYNNARDAAVDAAGNLYITGYFTAPLSFGGGNLPSAGALDVYVASFTSTGAFRWANSFGGSSDDWGNRLVLDHAGNVTVTGFFESTFSAGGQMFNAAGSIDGFVVSYTSTGAYRWAKRFGSSACDAGRQLVVASAANDLWLSGTYAGTVNLGGGPMTATGSTDAFLLLLDTNGNYLDQRALGGPGSDDLIDFDLDLTGGIVATGRQNATTGGCRNDNDYSGGDGYLLRL